MTTLEHVEIDAAEGRLNLGYLTPLLRATRQYQDLLSALHRGSTRVKAQVLSDAVPFLATALVEDVPVPTVILVPKPEEARRLHERLTAWLDDPDRALLFPETETLPYERLVTDLDTVQQRICTLDALLNPHDAPPLVVASSTSAVQRTLSRKTFENSAHMLSVGQTIDLRDTLDSWRRMGYRIESAVYSPGFVSRRGGIIDIFPVGSELPARIELWGDEVDSIRLFDPSTQRSTDTVESIRVIPAHETLPAMTDHEELDRLMGRIDVSTCDEAHRERIREEFSQLMEGGEVEDLNLYAGFFNHGRLADYIPPNALVVHVRPGDIAAAAWDTQQRVHDLCETKEARG